MAKPWIETPRLTLRRPALNDAPAIQRILSDPAVIEHNPSDRLTSVAAADALIGRWLEHWTVNGFGNGVVVASDGTIVGMGGVRWMTVRDTRLLNLMYRLAPPAWGHGFATEAARGLISWSAERLPDELILARIRPANRRSRSVAVRCGLRRDPTLDDPGLDGIDWAFTSRRL